MTTPNPFGAPVDQDFDLDLTEVTTGGGLPVGTYLAMISDVRQSVSGPGNPQIEWEWTVIQGPETGRTMILYTVLTKKAMFRVGEVVEALGIGERGNRVNFKKADAIGRKAIIEVETNQFTDRNGNKRSGTKIGAIKALSAEVTAQAAAQTPSGLPR